MPTATCHQCGRTIDTFYGYDLINAQAPAAGVCYAIPDNDQVARSFDTLVVFDPVTALTARLGKTNTIGVEAMALDPQQPIAYITQGQYFGMVNLRTVLATMSPEPIGYARGINGRINIADIASLAFDPLTNTLFAVQRLGAAKPDLLVKIDPLTGKLVSDAFGIGQDYLVIEGTPQNSTIQDIARDSLSGRIYAIVNRPAQDSMLLELDPVTGVSRIIGDTRTPNLQGLTVAADGILYASSGNVQQGDQLYRIDPATGATTLVGGFSIERDYEAISCLPAQ